MEANRHIRHSLAGTPKEVFVTFLEEHEPKREGHLWRYFRMLDKTDPIIAVWRYIAVWRDHIDIDLFLEAMDDFFTARTPDEIDELCIDNCIAPVIHLLMNKEYAQKYYRDGTSFFEHIPLDSTLRHCLQKIVEDRNMHYVA